MSQIHVVAAGPVDQKTDLPHVLLVVDGFPKALGGGERIVLRMARLLPQYGFRASILTFALHPESEFHSMEAPCPVYLLPLTSTYTWQAARGALELRRFLRTQQVRIVQTFFESSDIWAGFVTRLFSSARLVWNRRDMGILRTAKHRHAYRALRMFPHAVFAVSARVAEYTTAVDGVTPAKVHVVYNGLDLMPQTTLRDASEPHRAPGRVITTVGNIRHVKGHDLIIQAAAEVVKHFPAAHFTIAGDVLEPLYFASLQEQIKQLGLSENFKFVGKVTNLAQHLKTASLFLLPSRSEGFSNALVEAMAAGVPCIATDVGGNAEAISSGCSGLIIPPEDAHALAEAILSVLADRDLAEKLGQQGRLAVEQNFTTDAMMRKVAEVFSSLLAV